MLFKRDTVRISGQDLTARENTLCGPGMAVLKRLRIIYEHGQLHITRLKNLKATRKIDATQPDSSPPFAKNPGTASHSFSLTHLRCDALSRPAEGRVGHLHAQADGKENVWMETGVACQISNRFIGTFFLRADVFSEGSTLGIYLLLKA